MILFLLSGIAFCQTPELPAEVQWKLFEKILHFDRNLKVRSGKEITIGILYQSRYRSSLNTAENFYNAVVRSKIKQIDYIPIRLIRFDLSDPSKLENMLLNNEIDILYISPLRAFELINITNLTRKFGILTMTAVPEYAEQGISVAVGLKSEKPEIYINVSASKDENIDFSSKILKLAKVIE